MQRVEQAPRIIKFKFTRASATNLRNMTSLIYLTLQLVNWGQSHRTHVFFRNITYTINVH